MFFKSRTQRDIDHFREMQDRDSRRIQEGKRLEQLSSEIVASSTDEGRLGLDQTGGVNPKELAGEEHGHRHSVVSINATWEGKLKTEGSAWLEGQISGQVEAGETVFIAMGARVRANIHARRAIIGGDMEGHIQCLEQVVVEGSGRLGGRVTTKTLVIEDGAVVHSEIQMVRDQDKGNAVASDAFILPPLDFVASSTLHRSQHMRREDDQRSRLNVFEQERKE